MNLSLLVLAAGLGSRYGGLKQLDPVGPNGESLLEYSVYDSLHCGFNQAVVIIRRDFEKEFRNQLGKRLEAMTDVRYVFQDITSLPLGIKSSFKRTKPWGTAHAIWSARSVIDIPFAVINADDFYGRDAFRAVAEFLPTAGRSEYAMVAYELKNTLSKFGGVARGICEVDADGYLASVVETFDIESDGQGTIKSRAHTELSPDTLVSMNLWGFSPQIFKAIELSLTTFLQDPELSPSSEFYIPKVVEGLIRSREARVRVLKTSAKWFGLTYLQDRDEVRDAILRLIESGDLPNMLAPL